MTILKHIAIFQTGEHNGREFDAGDLQSLVQYFEDRADSGKVPVKRGHDASDGDDALGWVTALRVDGDTVYADFELVGYDLKKRIESGAVKYPSVEIVKESGGWRLVGVAILGSAMPGVETLPPLHASIGGERHVYTFARSIRKPEDDETERLRRELAASHAQQVALLFSAAITSGRILPREQTQFLKRYGDTGTPADATEWIATAPRPPEDHRQRASFSAARQASFTEQLGDGTVGDEVAKRVEKFAKEERLDLSRAGAYEQANRLVFRKHPRLAKAYLADQHAPYSPSEHEGQE